VQRSEVLRDDFPHAFRFHIGVPVHEAVAKPGDRRSRNLGMAVRDRLGEQACGLGERLEPVQGRVANVRIVLECRRAVWSGGPDEVDGLGDVCEIEDVARHAHSGRASARTRSRMA